MNSPKLCSGKHRIVLCGGLICAAAAVAALGAGGYAPAFVGSREIISDAALVYDLSTPAVDSTDVISDAPGWAPSLARQLGVPSEGLTTTPESGCEPGSAVGPERNEPKHVGYLGQFMPGNGMGNGAGGRGMNGGPGGGNNRPGGGSGMFPGGGGNNGQGGQGGVYINPNIRFSNESDGRLDGQRQQAIQSIRPATNPFSD